MPTSTFMPDSKHSLDVLTVLYAPLEQYPPSRNQIALLSEAGLRVGVIDAGHPDLIECQFANPDRVQRFHAVPHTFQHREPLPNPAVRMLRMGRFARCIRRLAQIHRPKILIAYDTFAFYLTGRAWRRKNPPFLIWHFHEMPSMGKIKKLGALVKHAETFFLRNANQPDMLVFPDAGRARFFADYTGVTKPPRVVMNCPRLVSCPPESPLRKRLGEWGMASRRVVYYHGWMSPSHGLEPAIRSMQWWPEDAVLVLVGSIGNEYKDTLKTLAREVGVADRIVFPGSFSMTEALTMAAGADVGYSVYTDRTNPKNLYSAGGSVKRFDYMAVGLPQVANRGPGMEEIIETPGCGLLADPDSDEGIGQCIRSLLEDSGLNKTMRDNARMAHIERFNYEYQFRDVLQLLLDRANS